MAAPAHAQRTSALHHLTATGAALQLTPTQAPLWQAYVTAVTNQRAARRQWMQEHPRPAVLTLPQKIDRREAMVAQLQPARLAADGAMKQLYAALSPGQQLVLELRMAHHGHGRAMGATAG